MPVPNGVEVWKPLLSRIKLMVFPLLILLPSKQTNQFNHFLIGFQKEILQRGSARSLSSIDHNENLPFQSGAKWMCRDQTEPNALAAKPWKEPHYFMAVLLELEPNLAFLEILQFYVPDDPAHLGSCGNLEQVLRQEWSQNSEVVEFEGRQVAFFGLAASVKSFTWTFQAFWSPARA